MAESVIKYSYDHFPLLPIACSELDFFMLSGVFIVLPLDPEWGKKIRNTNRIQVLTSDFLDGTESLGQPSVGLRPTGASLEILMI